MTIGAFSDGAPWRQLWRCGRGLLDDDFVRLVIGIIAGSGIVEQSQQWREGERRGPGGRPERFSLEAVLVAMAILVLIGEPPHLIRVRDIMFRRISPQMRLELGISDPPDDSDVLAWDALYRCVRYRWHSFIGLIDPSWLPKNRRLDDITFTTLAASAKAGHSPEKWNERFERLVLVINQIIEAGLDLIPPDVRSRWDGTAGVDATLIRSPARSERRAGRSRGGKRQDIITHSADPDAGTYSRPADDRDGGGGGRIAYGYEATMVVSGRDPKSEAATPNVVVAMAPLHRPGAQVGANAIVALQNLRGRDHPAHYLAADRAYSSAKPEDFQLPARALGYDPVFDYKIDQLGIKASYQGFVQIEGAFYCPAIPQALIDASADYRAGTIDHTTYRARLDERWKYLARAKGQPDADGHYRLMCPAASNWPLARCANKPDSLSNKTRGRLRIQVNSGLADNPPPCCAQQSVTMAPEAGAKFAQPLLYKSDDWQRAYSTIRNTNEGMHGYAKDGAYEALDDPRRRRVLGGASQSVQVAFVVMAANVRKIASSLEEQDRIEQARIPGVRKKPPRRRTRGLGTWRPDNAQGPPESTGPPPSA